MKDLKNRAFWLKKIEMSWRRPILWLFGVRRVGKTCLSRAVPDIVYFDCELPRVRRMMDDAEGFWRDLKGCRVVLDEIHRLKNPSEILKIASDHFTDIKVIATGSSRLGASSKFRDTLTGRKTDLLLTPMIESDLEEFGSNDLSHRMLRGGLPDFFLDPDFPEPYFQEWMDSFWAKDIQELFRLNHRHAFQKLIELLLNHSGGIFEATRYSRQCEVSRTTISNYVAILEETGVIQIIRPYSSYRPTEIVSAPKIYGFDTGFVCYHKGWYSLRSDDYGILWEHYVLNEIRAHFQDLRIHYWRNKRGHEVDFVIAPRNRPPIAIECKWSAAHSDVTGIKAFRRQYPEGDNFVVAHDVDVSYLRSTGSIQCRFVSLSELIRYLDELSSSL